MKKLSMTENAIYLRKRYRRLHNGNGSAPTVEPQIPQIQICIPRSYAPRLAKLIYRDRNDMVDGETVESVLGQLITQLL